MARSEQMLVISKLFNVIVDEFCAKKCRPVDYRSSTVNSKSFVGKN